jgi:NADPH2:quinone reductase
MLVSFGQMSGALPPIDANLLRDKGSLFFTRPSLFEYKQDFDEYHLSAAEVLDMIMRRHLRLHIMQSFRLEDAAFAHQQLESGKTKGPSVFLVGN